MEELSDQFQVGVVSPVSGLLTVQVTTLTGDTKEVEFTESMTVTMFKGRVKEATGVPPEKQRLVYNEREIEVEPRRFFVGILFVVYSMYCTVRQLTITQAVMKYIIRSG